MAKIKAAGKGDIEHYPEIEQNYLNKIYNSIYLDPNTPTGLANRVQINALVYFCRRANENMDSMTKNTFVVKQYADNGRKYVVKKENELSENLIGKRYAATCPLMNIALLLTLKFTSVS